MKHCFIIIMLMVCAFNANAQTYLDHLQQEEAGKGHVAVQQSQELDALINGTSTTTSTTTSTSSKPNANKQERKESQKEETTEQVSSQDELTIDETTTARTGKKQTGYRVQVFAGGNSGADKTKATQIGEAIRNRFPGHTVYVRFVSPRWICRMGNFPTKEEAQEMLSKVKAAGYSQACLVKGTITVYE